ncbi:MAG TPA: amidase [Candidatus Bathyarchaeia archaeon]|nr:amidase [Candidatus Bathyarchaeia archaeon]
MFNNVFELDLIEYAQHDGLSLGELVKRRKITSKDLGRLFLAAVAKVNPKINAVIEAYDDHVNALDEKIVPDGPFAGVPFLMKDIGATEKGRRQEQGSRLMKGYVANKDSFLTTRFKQAGLTLLGRTTIPEFAMANNTVSVLTGVTRNPWNLELMAGGSSGGAAASVASGIVPVAMASDGGGSIRIPASACGVVGLKPSRGRVTAGPDFGEVWGGLLQEFVISRSIRDTAVMLDAVSQPTLGDPFIIAQPQRPYCKEVNAPAGKLHIAWTTASWQPGTAVHPEVVRCVEEVASKCEEMGHDVVEASPIFDYEGFLHALCVVLEFGFDVRIDTIAGELERKLDEDTLEPVTLSYLRCARLVRVADLIRADSFLNKLRRSFGQFFQGYDVLLTPTLAQPPEPLSKYVLTRTDLDFVAFTRLGHETDMFLPVFNVTGQPAISLPLGQTKAGLPVGAQFIARFGEEATLIRLASAFEHATPWRDRIPPMHVSR